MNNDHSLAKILLDINFAHRLGYRFLKKILLKYEKILKSVFSVSIYTILIFKILNFGVLKIKCNTFDSRWQHLPLLSQIKFHWINDKEKF